MISRFFLVAKLYLFSRQTEDQIQTALEQQSVHSSVDEHYEEMMQYAEHHQEQHQLLSQEVVQQNYTPPALPPKVPIIYFIEGRSPSRHKQRGLHLAGALMDHFLEGSTPLRLW